MKVIDRPGQLLIGGRWIDPTTGTWFDTINPFTGKAWGTVARAGIADVERAVSAAHEAFHAAKWRGITASARGALLVRLGELIAANAVELARIESQDNGKLIAEMSAQLGYIPEWFRYFGGLADKIEGRVLPIDKPSTFAYTREEPLGVIGVITPWNSPLLLAAWKLAPALAAGNTIVWKPSEFSSASALAFGQLFEEAGFPPGVVNIVTGFGNEIGDALVDHRQISKVAFTGGDATGQRIYQRAAEQIKPVTLELGGKSANIVFSDSNLDHALNGVISGIFAATGQTCIAGSRALVQRDVYEGFVTRLVDFARQARLGDPLDPQTQVGPVTTEQQLRKILDYIDIGRAEGARCVLGGARPVRPECGDGWFVEPTIFTDVAPSMRIAQEEIFGPVLSVIPFEDEEDAVRIANGTMFGLAAGIWTSNIRRALTLPTRLEAGTVWVNTYRAVSYLAPFGGYKRSGLGRESGQAAIHEYLQTKTVWIDTSETFGNPFIIR
ncbi:aldehyde dehydrogenase [Lichenicoccus sp.]|uniref:aldehyde dehydrogenase n=1 Tax=Lichenicoccus sp. TaxID=2781899 RepID=UPI003D117AB5